MCPPVLVQGLRADDALRFTVHVGRGTGQVRGHTMYCLAESSSHDCQTVKGDIAKSPVSRLVSVITL